VAARPRVAVIVLLLAIIFTFRIVVADPSVGVSFLALVPVMLGSWWFGRTGGLLVALSAVLLYLLTAPFTPQTQLATAVAVHFGVFCAVAIAFARLLDERGRLFAEVASRDQELSELRALRAALIPADVPERPELELASVFAPAAGGVGGDFYLVAQGPEDATVVVVGDVVGKGVDAARRASFVRAALATFSEFTDEPCRLLELANAVLIERVGTSSNFVTAVCASCRPGDPVVRWAVAGHPPPVRLDSGVVLDGLRPGVPLGIEVELNCELGEEELAPGQGVVLFTDGLIEARPTTNGTSDGAHPDSPLLFGLEGVERVLAQNRGESPRRVVDALRAAAMRASDGNLADDLCIVALRARG
jgi:serine phosphatase RsbU (regulator of sigma subunit)